MCRHQATLTTVTTLKSLKNKLNDNYSIPFLFPRFLFLSGPFGFDVQV